MRQNSQQESPRLPGVIATLSAGFELTTSRLWLILIPVFLDLFYWLGPRLKITQIVGRSAELLSSEPALADIVENMLDIAPRINLFTWLSVIGVPTLMGGAIPERTPLKPATFEYGGEYSWMLILLSLGFIGLGLTALYLELIGLSLTGPNKEDPPQLAMKFRAFLRALIRLTGFIIIVAVIFFVISIPLLPVAFLLAMVDSSFFLGVIMVGFIVVGLYLSMTIPGIFVNGRPLIAAMRESLKIVFRNLMSTVILLVAVYVIANGTDLLWRWADDGSWITLVSIIGHGFITTALACAIFVFYKSRYAHFIEQDLQVNGLRK